MTERIPSEDDRLHIQFTDAESENIHAAAQWYREFAEAQGFEVPEDPMRCVLALAGALQHRVLLLETILARAGIDPSDYMPPAGRPH